MSSVVETIECPRCGGICTTEYSSTGEEYEFCARCGKYEEYVLVREKDGRPSTNKDGDYKYEYTNREGFGCARISYKQGCAQLFSLPHPVDQDIIDDFQKIMEDPNVDKGDSYLSSWDPEKKEVVMIYGKMPETFAEFNERLSKEISSDEQVIAVSDSIGA